MGCPNNRSVVGCGVWQRVQGKIDVISEFLTEVRRKPAQTIVGVPGGITTGNINQGPGSIAQVGGEHNNATVNNFGVHRQIQENIKLQLIANLSVHKGTVTINCVGCDGETMQFANDWYEVLSKAGWIIKSRPNSVITPDTLVGVSITIRGEPVSPGEKFEVPNDSPAGSLARAVMATVPQRFAGFRKPDIRENEAILDIGIMPQD